MKAKKEYLKPRYPAGKYPEYDAAFRMQTQRSIIFNEELAKDYSHQWITRQPEWGIITRKGDENGLYQMKGMPYPQEAPIVLLNRDLASLEKNFRKWCGQQILKGETLTPPKEWPRSLMQQRVAIEGRLDVFQCEVDYLQALAKERADKAEAKRLAGILARVPAGEMGVSETKYDWSRQIHLVESVDGQRVSYRDNVPYIDEPTSPYNRMPLYHYQQMAEAWKKKHGITAGQIEDEWRKRAMAKLEEMEAAGDKSRHHGISQRDVKKEIFAAFAKSGAKLPAWPDKVPKIDELEIN